MDIDGFVTDDLNVLWILLFMISDLDPVYRRSSLSYAPIFCKGKPRPKGMAGLGNIPVSTCHVLEQ